MYDTIILEADTSKCVKMINITDGIVSEKLLVEKNKQAVIFIEFTTIESFQNNEIDRLKQSDYEEFDCGFSSQLNITLNDKNIRKIDLSNNYSILLKKMRPDFESEQIKGFSKEKLHLIRNNYARVFSYVICIEEKNNSLIQKKTKIINFNKDTIYTALSEKGFILGDIPLIKERIDNQSNLLEAFTTTELANELFQEGLMILSWGMTPYQYFIGFSKDVPEFIINDKYKRNFNGKYKVKKEISSLSLVKGELINDFKSVNNDNKHQLKFITNVQVDRYNYISLSLYVVDIDSCGNPISPVCFFILDNLNYEIQITEPALNYNIFS